MNTKSASISPPDLSFQIYYSSMITPFDAISRHLTPYLWQRLKVVTASQAQFWARGGFHTPLDVMLIFFAVNFFVNENDFDEFFGIFTIYSKMYKLFIVYLALDRNGKLIKSWKCRQLQDFWWGTPAWTIWSFVFSRYLKIRVSFFKVYFFNFHVQCCSI